MSKFTTFLGDIFRFHKLKLFTVLLSFMIFLLLMFPYNDLGTLVTTTVAEQTDNTVFIKFDDIGLSIFPIGLDFENVEVQTPMLPALRCEELTLSFPILSLLTFNPGVSAKANGLLKGKVSLSTQGQKKSSGNQSKTVQNVNLVASDVDLSSLLSLLSGLSGLNGRVDLKVSGLVDPVFDDQPDMNLQIEGENITLSNFSVATVMGDFPLPDLALRNLRLRGTLKEGRLNIEEAVIGDEADELFAQVKGAIRVSLESQRGQVTPSLNGYNLSVRIRTKKSFNDRASLFMAFIENMKTAASSAANPEYMFRVEASDVRMPPNMTPLTSFN